MNLDVNWEIAKDVVVDANDAVRIFQNLIRDVKLFLPHLLIPYLCIEHGQFSLSGQSRQSDRREREKNGTSAATVYGKAHSNK